MPLLNVRVEIPQVPGSVLNNDATISQINSPPLTTTAISISPLTSSTTTTEQDVNNQNPTSQEPPVQRQEQYNPFHP